MFHLRSKYKVAIFVKLFSYSVLPVVTFYIHMLAFNSLEGVKKYLIHTRDIVEGSVNCQLGIGSETSSNSLHFLRPTLSCKGHQIGHEVTASR